MDASKSLITVVALLVIAFAGCMASDNHKAQALQFRDHPVLGPILADPAGKTLYVFTNDERNVTKCLNQCAVAWPPYLVDALPQAPAGAEGKLGLIDRPNATQKQLTYRGLPLYYYQGDAAAGDAKGDGLNAVWFVVRKPPPVMSQLQETGSGSVDAANVVYSGTTTGYYAKPKSGSPAVGVVMVHEWWGLNDNIRHMARVLASHGYQVLAVDLFNGSVATTAGQAQAQVGALNQGDAVKNMRDAAKYLRDRGATEVVSLGWCFGGGQSLQLAMSGEPLAATVIYYGFVTNDTSKLGVIDWPVLGIFGESDQAIPPATVRSFETAMKSVSIDYDLYIYPDMGHAFANPSADTWAPEETHDAWSRTLDFLKAHTSA